jgi:hypothetical protein
MRLNDGEVWTLLCGILVLVTGTFSARGVAVGRLMAGTVADALSVSYTQSLIKGGEVRFEGVVPWLVTLVVRDFDGVDASALRSREGDTIVGNSI